ncbi:hypothetical protein ACVWYH_008374 [Bradyrhizobium sp. GM24.11]
MSNAPATIATANWTRQVIVASPWPTLSIAAMPTPKVIAESPALCQSKEWLAGGRMRQAAQADHERDHAERNVDGEQPGPAADCEDAGGERRPDRGGEGDDERVEPDAAAEQVARIGEANQRRVDAHDACRTKPLDDARGREQRQRMRQCAECGCEREQREPDQIDAAISDDLAERGQRQQRDGDRELVAVDDPDRERRACVQVGCDRRQRDIGDRAVDDGHEDAKRNGQDRLIALGLGQAVGMLDRDGRHGGGVLGSSRDDLRIRKLRDASQPGRTRTVPVPARQTLPASRT